MTKRRKKESLVLMLVLMSVIVITLSNVEPPAFAVAGGTAIFSTTSGPVGTVVTVTGSGWGPLETGLTFPSNPTGLAVNDTCNIPVGTGIISPGCQFTVAYGINPVTYTITVTGTITGATTLKTFTVTSPTVSVSPNQVGPTFFVTVTGSGFSPLDQFCSISVNTPITTHGTCSITGPGSGGIQGSFTVPSITPSDFGTYTVTVNGNRGNPPVPIDIGFTSIVIVGGVTSTSISTSFTSTTTVSTTTITSTTLMATSTSFSTTTFSSTGLTSVTYTIYSSSTVVGPTTTSITISPLGTFQFNVTTTGGTVFISITVPTTVTVSGFITGAVAQAASAGAPDYVGLLGMMLLLGWVIVRRLVS
ncbi:MAG: hypothetical protein ABSF82_08550 [Candidatus Bathyarchaeia archaeon]